MLTPGSRVNVLGSRSGTMNVLVPYVLPLMTSCAKTAQWVAVDAAPPIHHCDVSRVRGLAAHLGRADRGRVDDELVGPVVERRRRLEAGDVGAVRELGHAEAADDAVEAEDALLEPVAELAGLRRQSSPPYDRRTVAPDRSAPRNRP